MDVSIIIVNWNSKQFLRACIESVRRHTAGIGYEIIVVDSGSFDGCGELLRAEFPQVRFLQSDRNIGFAAANNLGCRDVGGRFVLFLNPDTELTSPAVNLMLAHLERCPDAGAVGCRLLNADGSVQLSSVQAFPTVLSQLLTWERLLKLRPTAALWGASPLLAPSAAPTPVDIVSGACLMLGRALFEQVGRFSEDYFMYAEDLDLCHKLRQAGRTNYHLPAATLRHFGGGSSDQVASEFSAVMMRESIWRFLRKSRGRWYGSAYRLSTLLSAVVRLSVLIGVCALGPDRNPARAPRAAIRKWLAILAWCLRLRSAPRPL